MKSFKLLFCCASLSLLLIDIPASAQDIVKKEKSSPTKTEKREQARLKREKRKADAVKKRQGVASRDPQHRRLEVALKQFALLDANGDGQLTSSEYMDGVRKREEERLEKRLAGLEKRFVTLDADKDSIILEDEFSKLVRNMTVKKDPKQPNSDKEKKKPRRREAKND